MTSFTDLELVWLGDPGANDIGLVGAKAANLSRLAGAYRVPGGFCLTASAMEKPMDSLRARIIEAYARLARESSEAAPPVAVRSSAIDEDSADASFAGQHETFLNVRGADSVVESIAKCYRSLSAPRALEYRRQRRLSVDAARMSVLVQRLVPAEASAVIFTANPVTGSRDEVVLTATWGLGESLVGGSVSPDSYVVRKSDLAMSVRYIATKRKMTALADTGTCEVDVPAPQQTRPAIDDDQVRQAVRLALDIERAFGWPVDVECAWHEGVLYLLQCRPITTL
jgi:pyruvate,water dikinase